MSNGAPPLVLIYYNLGKARVSGVDLGASVVATDHIEVRSTLSTVKLSDLVVPAGSEEATALNSPGTKWTLGASARDVGPWSGGLTFRNVNAYYFRSGTNIGVIPTFGTLDASLSFKIPQLPGTLVNVSVSNLYSCTANNVTYRHGHDAGQFGHRVGESRVRLQRGRTREMINMPEIGTMAFVGLARNAGERRVAARAPRAVSRGTPRRRLRSAPLRLRRGVRAGEPLCKRAARARAEKGRHVGDRAAELHRAARRVSRVRAARRGVCATESSAPRLRARRLCCAIRIPLRCSPAARWPMRSTKRAPNCPAFAPTATS